MKSIKDIVLLVLSALVLIFAIVLNVGWEIITLGVLLTGASVLNLIINKKK